MVDWESIGGGDVVRGGEVRQGGRPHEATTAIGDGGDGSTDVVDGITGVGGGRVERIGDPSDFQCTSKLPAGGAA